jgi:uncharacterized protein (TIGR04442 family)
VVEDIRLHGKVKETVEYFATVAGEDVALRHFFRLREERGYFYECYFTAANELRIGPFGVQHQGTGGWFSKYLFGENLPIPDLLRKEVRNRLLIHGATIAEDSGKIAFSDKTGGRKSFADIFEQGHPVSNYFFFVHSSDPRPVMKKQEIIVRNLGRFLKRVELEGTRGDSSLCTEMLRELELPNSTVFLFKIVDLPHREYRDTLRKFFFEKHALTVEEDDILYEMAFDYKITPRQRERIRMDVVCDVPVNRRIIEEYRDTIASIAESGTLDRIARARLARLNTLSAREKMPREVFDSLNRVLLRRQIPEEPADPAYVHEARAILEGLVLSPPEAGSEITPEDVVKLLRAKKVASKESEKIFEGMLLETGKNLDEKYRQAGFGSGQGPKKFSEIITLFDRFEAASMELNRIAYTEQGRVEPDTLRFILENRKVFESFSPGLFEELFVKDILEDKYLSRYGKQRVAILRRGCDDLDEGSRSIPELCEAINKVSVEEQTYRTIRAFARERLKQEERSLTSRENREAFADEIYQELRRKGDFRGEIPEETLHLVIVDLEKEVFYLKNILPPVLAGEGPDLREDFFANSGLDRFTIEEIEREYFESNGLDPARLQEIRKSAV